MDKYIYDENNGLYKPFMMKITVFGTNSKANTICRALPYRVKKKSLSGYGGSGTNAT